MASTYKVGDTYDLENHCLVSYPDGSVVTSNGSFRFLEAGEYRITYNDPDLKPVTVKVAERTGAKS